MAIRIDRGSPRKAGSTPRVQSGSMPRLITRGGGGGVSLFPRINKTPKEKQTGQTEGAAGVQDGSR